MYVPRGSSDLGAFWKEYFNFHATCQEAVTVVPFLEQMTDVERQQQPLIEAT